MSANRAEDQVIEVVQAGDRRQGLIQRYRQRQEVQQRTVAVPGRPQEEAGDVEAWGGLRRRKSAELRRHQAQMQETYRAAQRANYAREWGLALEVHGVQTSIRAIEMEEQELMRTHPQSLGAEIGEQLVLDSAARIRDMNTEAQESFRRKAFGNQ